MDDNSKPMPCHFCGNEADQFYFNGEGPPPSYAVECGYCGAQGPHGLGMNRGDHAGAQRQAVKLWNDFKPSAARLDECLAALQWAQATFDGVDNGHCRICRQHRLNDTKGIPQPCPNAQCGSHRFAAGWRR